MLKAKSVLLRACYTGLLLGACSPESGNGLLGADGGVQQNGDASTDASSDGGMSGETTRPPADLVDENCVDGQYNEVVADNTRSISGIPFDPNDLEAYYLAVLNIRYPTGAYIVEGGLMNTQLNCVSAFAGNPSSPERALDRLATVVHECGHFYDSYLGRMGRGDTFVISEGLRIDGNRGDTTSRGGNTFARSLIRINGPEFNALWRPCDGASGNCDFYADIYLNGSPTDMSFESGDQGFNLLLEEAVQYINSLATGYSIVEAYQGGSVSERDGLLAFLWYMERYLKMAREDFPTAYTFISGDENWRRLILTVWGRAWLFLDLTKNIRSLGIQDGTIEPLVKRAEMLEEIQRIREAHGCPSN